VAEEVADQWRRAAIRVKLELARDFMDEPAAEGDDQLGPIRANAWPCATWMT
jgi:hypothetical protein